MVRWLRLAHFLFFGGVMRKIDRLGRIVIPLALREKYGLTEGTDVEFLDGGDGITIRAGESLCRICHAQISDSQLPLCDSCIERVAREYNEKH